MRCNHDHCHTNKSINEKEFSSKLIINIMGILLFIVTLFLNNDLIKLSLFLISYIMIGYEIVINGIKSIFNKQILDENFLMTIATIGAFFIGEYVEGIAVLIFYQVGEFLQELAVNKSKKRIESTLNLKPEYANLKINNEIKMVKPQDLGINDIIIVKVGERIPVDGMIVKGKTLLDVSALTGESLPKDVSLKDEVFSGAINLESTIEIKVKQKFENSMISKIIELIENANNNKSESEKFITKFSKIYTPVVVLIALLIAIIPPLVFSLEFSEYIRRALIFLVISCPCALVLSIPLGYFAGIGACSKKGILVKGSNFLDYFTEIKTVVFDKTGTLTKGNFSVEKVVSTSNLDKKEIVKYLALCESFSTHPVAKAILNKNSLELNLNIVKKHQEISGYGIKAEIDNKEVLAGNDKLLKKYKIDFNKPEDIGTIIYLVINNKLKGYVIITDEIKEDSKTTIIKLKSLGIKNIVMLTGDNKIVAKNVGEKLNIKNIYSELLPQEKVDLIEKIKNGRNEKVVFVGDGINDGPVLATSDIGISMGAGSDLAIEAADVVLMNNELSKIVDAINISIKTRKIVLQNIIFAISIKIIFLILSGIGLTTMWLAVFADVGVSLLAVINALRIMRTN